MFRIALARLQQKHRTMRFPDGPAPALPDHFRGRPAIDADRCPQGCEECARACPTGAITINGSAQIDLGRCLFCTDCVESCPQEAVSYSGDYRLAVRRRADLVVESDE